MSWRVGWAASTYVRPRRGTSYPCCTTGDKRCKLWLGWCSGKSLGPYLHRSCASTPGLRRLAFFSHLCYPTNWAEAADTARARKLTAAATA